MFLTMNDDDDDDDVCLLNLWLCLYCIVLYCIVLYCIVLSYSHLVILASLTAACTMY